MVASRCWASDQERSTTWFADEDSTVQQKLNSLRSTSRQFQATMEFTTSNRSTWHTASERFGTANSCRNMTKKATCKSSSSIRSTWTWYSQTKQKCCLKMNKKNLAAELSCSSDTRKPLSSLMSTRKIHGRRFWETSQASRLDCKINMGRSHYTQCWQTSHCFMLDHHHYLRNYLYYLMWACYTNCRSRSSESHTQTSWESNSKDLPKLWAKQHYGGNTPSLENGKCTMAGTWSTRMLKKMRCSSFFIQSEAKNQRNQLRPQSQCYRRWFLSDCFRLSSRPWLPQKMMQLFAFSKFREERSHRSKCQQKCHSGSSMRHSDMPIRSQNMESNHRWSHWEEE